MTQPGQPARSGWNPTNKQATSESPRPAWTKKLVKLSSRAQVTSSPIFPSHRGGQRSSVYGVPVSWKWHHLSAVRGVGGKELPDRLTDPAVDFVRLKQNMGGRWEEPSPQGSLWFFDFCLLDLCKRLAKHRCRATQHPEGRLEESPGDTPRPLRPHGCWSPTLLRKPAPWALSHSAATTLGAGTLQHRDRKSPNASAPLLPHRTIF